MQKNFTALGLMSGTSGDGVDASIIHSNGVDKYELIKDKFFEYDIDIYNNIHLIKEQINTSKDLLKFSNEINDLERKITVFHAKVISEMDHNNDNLFIGFHGQTIFHNASEKKSVQLGDGNLLHQLTRRKIVYNFRKNDLMNGGQGAPLTPIFHQLIILKKKINFPVYVLNIGGIANLTIIADPTDNKKIFSRDIGPGNCLIDNWVRKNSGNKFDFNGNLSIQGTKNEIIIEQAQELYANRLNKYKLSFDVNDFDVSFVRGLSLEDGAATLTEFTGDIICSELNLEIQKVRCKEILLCGGGRKNKALVKKINKNISKQVVFKSIDEYGINGDFIESQAFAFLAIRTILKLPITFPNTTGCQKPCLGGKIIGLD